MATTSAYLDSVRAELWSRDMVRFVPNRVLPPPRGEPVRTHGDAPRVVFAGFPSDYSLAFLLALLRLDVELAGIVTSPGAHPAILGENALGQIAAHCGAPLLPLWRVNEEHSRAAIAALRPEAVLMASFDQIVGARALAIPPLGWLNVHPSLLPELRGPEPVYWAIADGLSRTGITLHRAVPRFDAGPILAQQAVDVTPTDTAGTLARRLTEAGVALLPEAMRRLLAGEEGEQPDLERGSYRPSVSHRRLESAPSAVAAERMVRAGVPDMPAWATLDDCDVYVLAAHVRSDAGGAATLRFPDGILEVLETSPVCGCHHDTPDCPHREGAA